MNERLVLTILAVSSIGGLYFLAKFLFSFLPTDPAQIEDDFIDWDI